MDREVDKMYGKSIILGVKKNIYLIPFYMKIKHFVVWSKFYIYTWVF